MKSNLVYVKEHEPYSKIIFYLFEHIINPLLKERNIPLIKITNRQNEQTILMIDHSTPNSYPICIAFYDLLNKKSYEKLKHIFETHQCAFVENHKIDYLSSIFYMVNSLQEYQIEHKNFDEFGRFKFEKTYQYTFKNITKNLVLEYVCCFLKEYLNIELTPVKSKIFLSHDIDTIYGSFFQDGLWALKKGRLDVLFRLVFNELLLQPSWLNIDKIKKLHNQYGLASTFFWLVEQKNGSYGIKNADYNTSLVKKFNTSFNHGLHKSSLEQSFDIELKKLPNPTSINRNHFLKFKLPNHYQELENSTLKVDCSLGFAEHYGFRNSYGMPFHPYNFNSENAYTFLEVPLTIMDATFRNYLKIETDKTASTILDFIETHKNNCVLSILWHNTFFSDYKYSGYLSEYVKILEYVKEGDFKTISFDGSISESHCCPIKV